MILTAESAQPLVQIGNQVFVGSYQDTLGTSLFFSQEEPDRGDLQDPVFGREAKTFVNLVAATRKKLWLKRVVLKERSSAAGTDSAADKEASVVTETASGDSRDTVAASKDN